VVEEPVLVAAAASAINDALAMALAEPASPLEPAAAAPDLAADTVVAVAQTALVPVEAIEATIAVAEAAFVDSTTVEPAQEELILAAATGLAPVSLTVLPEVRPTAIIMTAEDIAPTEVSPSAEPEVVTRISTSGGRHWGINVGRYNTRYEAERVLIQVALSEASTLDGALRRILQRSGGFDANFMGLSREGADLACRRLQARGTTCFMIGTDES
jgi:D-alanyl-D-alanine carboxypeptidase